MMRILGSRVKAKGRGPAHHAIDCYDFAEDDTVRSRETLKPVVFRGRSNCLCRPYKILGPYAGSLDTTSEDG